MATEIRFGILGCAKIARKVCRAITLAPNATVAAVGSRSLEKAKAFASANNFPPNAKVYGSYEEVLDDADVDAVYVPLPTGLHLRWAVLAAQKKKHILLEKPVSLNVAEFDAIVDACDSNGVQIMDATMWMHHPRTAHIQDFFTDTDRFGHLKMINTYFCYAGDEGSLKEEDFLKKDIRVNPELDGLGALGDAGWYCIRAILWASNYQLPNKVQALRGAVVNDRGVILSCGSSMQWEDGKAATFHCSFLSHLTMEITAIGTKGTFHLDDFVIPFHEKKATYCSNSQFWVGDLSCWVPTPKNHVLHLPQEALMVKEFSRLVGEIKNTGSKPDKQWPDISRKTQLVVDAVKASIDKGFQTVDL